MKYSIISILLLLSAGTTEAQLRKDSTILFREFLPGGGYHVVYVDHKRMSANRALLIAPFTKSEYEIQFALIRDSLHVPVTRQPVSRIAGKWYQLFSYKKKYYLYVPSDSGETQWIDISDSAMLQGSFDGGIRVSVFTNVRQAKRVIESTLINMAGETQSLKIHLIDSSGGIAVFERPNLPIDQRYMLMVSESKMKDYPIVVNYSPTSKMKEWQFDAIGYKKLLNQK